MPHRRQASQELLEGILLEMAAGHPALPLADELGLKQLLLDIMADELGWHADPDAMVRKFDEALQMLRTLRGDKAAWLE